MTSRLAAGHSRRRGGGRLLVLALLLAPPAPTSAATPAPEAAAILAQAEAVRSPAMDYALEFTLHARDPGSSWKERTARYSMIAHGKDYSIVMMHEPEAFYPGTLLIAEGLYWLLLPRSERSFQLSPRHVLNGDISNGDLARGNLVAHYAPRLEGEEAVHGVDCWRLELARTRNLALYARILAWIDKETYRPVKFQYFGQTGRLLKTAFYQNYESTPIGIRPLRIVVKSGVRPGETTTLTFSKLRPFESSRFDFTREGLGAVRDAARAHLERDATQAGPEDLLAALAGARP